MVTCGVGLDRVRLRQSQSHCPIEWHATPGTQGGVAGEICARLSTPGLAACARERGASSTRSPCARCEPGAWRRALARGGRLRPGRRALAVNPGPGGVRSREASVFNHGGSTQPPPRSPSGSRRWKTPPRPGKRRLCHLRRSGKTNWLGKNEQVTRKRNTARAAAVSLPCGKSCSWCGSLLVSANGSLLASAEDQAGTERSAFRVLLAVKNSRSPAAWINLLLTAEIIGRGDQLFNYRLRRS